MQDKKKNVIDRLDTSVIYNLTQYGISQKYSGSGVSVALLDTGKISHNDISCKEFINFTSDSDDDVIGHAHLMSGIMCGNGKMFKGYVPDINLYNLKVFRNSGSIDLNAVVAAMLWAISNKINVIVMAFGSSVDFPPIKDLVVKAYGYNIAVVTSYDKKNKFPSSYSESLAFNAVHDKKISRNIVNLRDIVIPHSGIVTTYINNKYTKSKGSSIASAIGASLVSAYINKANDDKESYGVRAIYSAIK